MYENTKARDATSNVLAVGKVQPLELTMGKNAY
jgi:hypothetical protein